MLRWMAFVHRENSVTLFPDESAEPVQMQPRAVAACQYPEMVVLKTAQECDFA